ncbi:glycerate kinase [Xylophilus sp. ASV27]|uniref:glycerate kinase n=1 Tax=Xylophilus sp. ASV27 TaxID=2795129 RepID=UPI0018EDFA5A|nr:glycerate kinase [Xylophilus sp. ASV27]
MNNFPKVLIPVGSLVLLAAAFSSYGWRGVAVVSGGLLMWLLLHFTRLMTVLKRAADRPVGYVGSAVMLNAKLRPRLPLLHVVALTKSLGQQQSPADTQPEVFRWTDGGGSYVDCTFAEGRLVHWQLTRPQPPAGTP